MKPLSEMPMKALISRTLPTLAVLTFFVIAPHAASAQTPPQPTGPPHRLSTNALRQIAALEAEADTRTPQQQKISSQLLFTLKMARGQAIAPGVPVQRTSVVMDGAGLTLIDIKADVTPALMTAIQRLGGQVIGSSVRFGQVRARVPLTAVEALASLPEVRLIKPAAKSQLQNSAPVKSRAGQAQRRAEISARLPGLLSQISTTLPGLYFSAAATGMNPVGSVVDEGDKTHRADTARAAFRVDGSGIKVGVLSDSLDNGNGIYSDALASGDVSTVSVISGQSGGNGTGEGLAMLEVVHHLAPGAQLYFATGASGEGQFADNIIALQKAGCKVIIDDEAYGDESPFQDDIVARAINTVTANGVMYFSCAANYGNLANFKSSVWENDFSSSGNNDTGDGLTHEFDANGDELDQIQANSGQATVSLFWSDPLGKSGNDYDLFIVDPNGNIVASSTNRQTGSQDPYEQADAADGDSIAIVLHSGATRFLHVDLDAQNSILNFATNDRTRGHNAAANAFCVAATPAAAAFGSGQPSGPYPNPFNSSDVVETFSDDGPRHIFYNPDGSAITTDLTHTGGKILYKPDFTAADGTSTTLTQSEVGSGKEALSPFFGTSCAAPHAGAIAALVLSYNKSLTRTQLASILKGSATDIMASGYDIDSGSGILNAYAALQATPSATTATSVAVANVTGSAGQTVSLSATLKAGTALLSGKTLTFKVDTATVGTAVTNSGGAATLSYAISGNAATGSHTVTVSFAGDSGDAASSGTGTLTVTAANKLNTVVTVGARTGAHGTTVSLKSILKTSAGAVLAGKTLTYTVNGVAAGSAVTDSTGLATLNYAIPASAPAGNEPIVVSFGGDSGDNASTGTGTLTVTASTLSTSVTVASVSGGQGQTVSLSATLKAGTTALSGKTLTFKVDSTVVGTAVTSSSGVAARTYAIPANDTTGSHTISVSFAGDGGDAASSGTGTLTVTSGSKLNTVVTVGARSGKAGTTVSLKSTLKTSAGAALAGKTLTYTVNGVAAGSAVTDSTGLATLSYTIPASAPAGNEPIAVSFGGDSGNNAGSGKGTLTVA